MVQWLNEWITRFVNRMIQTKETVAPPWFIKYWTQVEIFKIIKSMHVIYKKYFMPDTIALK